MTDNVTQIRREPDRFGGCPTCGGDDGCLNVGRSHWFVCRRHKVRWFVGANLFSSWRHEEEWDWEENARVLEGYEEVEPLMPEPPEDAPRDETDLFEDILGDEELLEEVAEQDLAARHEDEDLYWRGA